MFTADLDTVLEWAQKLRDHSVTKHNPKCPFASWVIAYPFDEVLTEYQRRDYSIYEDGKETIFQKGKRVTYDKQSYYFWFDSIKMMLRCFEHLKKENNIPDDARWEELMLGFKGDPYHSRCATYLEKFKLKVYGRNCDTQKKCDKWIDEALNGNLSKEIKNAKSSWESAPDYHQQRYGCFENFVQIRTSHLKGQKQVDTRSMFLKEYLITSKTHLNDPMFQLVHSWTDYQPIVWLPYVDHEFKGQTDEECFKNFDWNLFAKGTVKFNRSQSHLVPAEFHESCLKPL
jgi:hypothetical protein